MHFLFVVIAYFFADDIKIERIYDHGRRLVFYGIAGKDCVYHSDSKF